MPGPIPVSCSHSNVKKVARIGKKCAMCNTRVWKFWKTRKCRDCKIVLHRSCVTAWEQNTARQAVVAVSMPRAAPAEAQDNRLTPLYVAPRPWIWENVTTVVVDCRRRAVPSTVTVSNGYELTTATFAELFEPLLPPTTVVPHELGSSVHPSMFEAVIAELAEAFSRSVIALAVESMAEPEQMATGDGDRSRGKVECETSF